MAQSKPLDQLEMMVNRVVCHNPSTTYKICPLTRTQLEQTGRIFSESAKGHNNGAIAQGTRLKQILPTAINGFHEALDELETELVGRGARNDTDVY